LHKQVVNGLDVIIDNFEVFHTQSEEYVVSELLRINNLNEDVFDQDKMLKQILKSKYKMKNI